MVHPYHVTPDKNPQAVDYDREIHSWKVNQQLITTIMTCLIQYKIYQDDCLLVNQTYHQTNQVKYYLMNIINHEKIKRYMTLKLEN